MAIYFGDDNAFGKLLLSWWDGLDDDRAGRAILRRAHSVTAVTLAAPYQHLYRSLCTVGWKEQAKPWHDDRLAALVGVLAHVGGRSHAKANIAQTMSRAGPGADRPPVSELRFLRLLDSPDIESLFSGLRRVLPLIGKEPGLDVLTLANDVIHWGDTVKKRWAYSYEWPEKSKN